MKIWADYERLDAVDLNANFALLTQAIAAAAVGASQVATAAPMNVTTVHTAVPGLTVAYTPAQDEVALVLLNADATIGGSNPTLIVSATLNGSEAGMPQAIMGTGYLGRNALSGTWLVPTPAGLHVTFGANAWLTAGTGNLGAIHTRLTVVRLPAPG